MTWKPFKRRWRRWSPKERRDKLDRRWSGWRVKPGRRKWFHYARNPQKTRRSNFETTPGLSPMRHSNIRASPWRCCWNTWAMAGLRQPPLAKELIEAYVSYGVDDKEHPQVSLTWPSDTMRQRETRRDG